MGVRFRERYSCAIKAEIGEGCTLHAAPVSVEVVNAFVKTSRFNLGEVGFGYHGTSKVNLPSIFANGLLIPGSKKADRKGVGVVHGKAYGTGIYTASPGTHRLSLGYSDSNQILVVGIINGGHVRDCGTIRVVTRDDCVVPLLVATVPPVRSPRTDSPTVFFACAPPFPPPLSVRGSKAELRLNIGPGCHALPSSPPAPQRGTAVSRSVAAPVSAMPLAPAPAPPRVPWIPLPEMGNKVREVDPSGRHRELLPITDSIVWLPPQANTDRHAIRRKRWYVKRCRTTALARARDAKRDAGCCGL